MEIHGYELISDWKVVGGMSEVAFARKDGKEWFIKKFISPKFPLPGGPGSKKLKERQRKKCEVFEKHHIDINERLSSVCGLGGSLIFTVDFFREGCCYYKINEKINCEDMSVEDINELDSRNLLIIMRSLVNSLRILHHAKIVHGDLKPENILIKLTSTGLYTTKLIDFDDSYISGNPPTDRSLVVGTPEYYSPEMYQYITDEDATLPKGTLTTKSDMFSLGVILTEYITGQKPIIPDKYSGTYSAVAAGERIEFEDSDHLTTEMEEILRKLLDKEPSKRPSIDELFSMIPVPKPKKNTTPKIIRFESSTDRAIRDASLKLSWAVENASSVLINDIEVPTAGSKVFKATEEYIIVARDNEDKIARKKLTVAIEEIEPEPKSSLRGTLARRRHK